MSNPAAPRIPDEPAQPGTPGVSDDDAPNPFGPDSPNFRPDDPPIDGDAIEAPPPEPSSIPLDDDDFAPDET